MSTFFPSRGRLRASLRAVCLIGLIVIGQFALLEHLLVAQRDSAHVIDVSGSQRMRSQRIAYLVESIHAHGRTASEEAELRGAIADMARVRAELLASADEFGGAAVFEAPYGLASRVRPYLAAAAAFARDPHDEAAYREVLARRVDLLDHLDQAVKGRAEAARRDHDRLAFLFAAASVATLLTLAVAWLRIVLPNERALENTLRKVIDSADHRLSLLDENPNSVGFFDRSGTIVQGNLASLRLLGRTETLVGRDLSEVVARRAVPAAMEAFQRALRGIPSTYETVLIDASGGEVDVEATVFPNVVNGSIVGVISLAKDIRATKLLQSQMRENTERISELYRIAATHGRSHDAQIEDTLALVAARLGYDWAVLSEVADGVVVPLALVGRPSGLTRGRGVPLDRALSRHVVSTDDIWAVGDLGRSEFAAGNVPQATGFVSSMGETLRIDHHASKWGAVAIAPVRTGDRFFGTLTIGSERPRAERLSSADAEFLRAVSGLLGLIIERGQHERRLGDLAYFDALTGLPNRVTLMDRMGAIGASAERHAREYAVLYLDLDRFKTVNDTFGHATGDEMLRLAARRMRQCVREDDTVARLGGDEFVILLPTPYGRVGAEELAARVLGAMAKPFAIDGTSHRIGVSIGIALYPSTAGNPGELLQAADEALYRAKRAGRNQMAFAA